MLKNLKIDSKKRITLGKMASAEVSSYDAELLENGSIILHPRVEIPLEELWLYNNKSAMKSVQKGIEQSHSGEVQKLDAHFWDDIK